MLFNSIEFVIFFPVVFILYWFAFHRTLKTQNFFIVVSSFFFYGWWDWRFLFLLIFSSGIDYFTALKIEKTDQKKIRKFWLMISISVNLGILAFFKYFNFFAESFVDAFTLFGYHLDSFSVNIILPVGVSFYTFQALSYTIDVYRGTLKPTKDPVAYFAFISFFPQLVAGPIERAANLLPQFQKNRIFDYGASVDGLRQMLWGLFKKMVVADNCAPYVNQIFDNYESQTSSTLLLGAFLFAVQIYGDFSGYSDVAIGSARTLGFSLMRNFNFPYFSRDIAEFWRRWHISLSTWFRDYLYYPLGGSKASKVIVFRNVLVVFIVSGLWHGANWTFLFWGFFHALLYVPLLFLNLNRQNTGNVEVSASTGSLKTLFSIALTFFLVTLGWVFFRSETLSQAFGIFTRMFSVGIFSVPTVIPGFTLLVVLIMFTLEWVMRNRSHAFEIQYFPKRLFRFRMIRYSFYAVLMISILWYRGKQQEFIYFDF